MVNRNYQNGKARELRTVHKLKSIGCEIAFRSAGSHSQIDVVGIDSKTARIFLLQCKPKSMSAPARKRLLETLGHLNGEYTVTVEVV